MPFVPEGEITAIEFAPLQAGVAFLGTSLGAVYRTADGGGHWELINSDTLFGIRFPPSRQLPTTQPTFGLSSRAKA